MLRAGPSASARSVTKKDTIGKNNILPDLDFHSETDSAHRQNMTAKHTIMTGSKLYSELPLESGLHVILNLTSTHLTERAFLGIVSSSKTKMYGQIDVIFPSSMKFKI